MHEAGIEWIRHGFPFPFSDRIGGAPTQRYQQAKAAAASLVEKGFKIMGVTPGPGVATQKRGEDGHLTLSWQSSLPEWMGPLGSEEFLDNYEELCAWIGNDLKGLVSAWQVANELDWWQFRGPQDLGLACEMIFAGACGLKDADESLIVGHNTAGTERAYFLYGRLHPDTDELFDYCGVDHYYGTWSPGGPEDWAEEIAEINTITEIPVMVSEWGFSSAGSLATEEQRRQGLAVCETKSWHFTWGPGHTPEGQAAFVEGAFEAFRAERDALMGLFFYRWEDQETCWQCGEPDCPAETAWGLVDREGNPKPAYYAFKEGVKRLLA